MCLTSLDTCVKGVQFYCPSLTYPAIPYCTIFQFLVHCVASSTTRGELSKINEVDEEELELKYSESVTESSISGIVGLVAIFREDNGILETMIVTTI